MKHSLEIFIFLLLVQTGIIINANEEASDKLVGCNLIAPSLQLLLIPNGNPELVYALIVTCEPPTIPSMFLPLSCTAIDLLFKMANIVSPLKTLLMNNIDCAQMGQILKNCPNSTQSSVMSSIGPNTLIPWEANCDSTNQIVFLTSIDVTAHITFFRSLTIPQQVLQLNAFTAVAISGWMKYIQITYVTQGFYFQLQVCLSFKLSSLAATMNVRGTGDKLLILASIYPGVVVEYVQASIIDDQYLKLLSIQDAYPLLLASINTTIQSQLLYMWDFGTFIKFMAHVPSPILLQCVQAVNFNIWITYSTYSTAGPNTTTLQTQNLVAMTPVFAQFIASLSPTNRFLYISTFDTTVFANYIGTFDEAKQLELFESIGVTSFTQYAEFVKNSQNGAAKILLLAQNINGGAIVSFIATYATTPSDQTAFFLAFTVEAATSVIFRLSQGQIYLLLKATLDVGMQPYLATQSPQVQLYFLTFGYSVSVDIVDGFYQVVPGSSFSLLTAIQLQKMLSYFPANVYSLMQQQIESDLTSTISQKIVIMNMYYCGYLLGYTYTMNSTNQSSFLCEKSFSDFLAYKNPSCNLICNNSCTIQS